MLINTSDEPIVAATKTSNPTLLLSNQPMEKTNSTVYLGQNQPLSKSEQTLIINSDGTPAALITPVTVPQTQVALNFRPISI